MAADGALGQMTKAPLALVLAQVRFSDYLTIGNRIPAIQDALRKRYPLFRKGQTQTIAIEIGATGPTISTADRWELVDADNQEAFIVLQNSLVFLATRYQTYKHFAERHNVVLEAFEQTVPDVFVERLGLRYIDIIVPEEGKQPQEYLVEGLRGFPMDVFDSATAFQSRYIARWRTDGGMIAFRHMTGVKPPFLPPDLQPLELQPPDVVKLAWESKAPVSMLDFDRMLDYRGPFNAVEISKKFALMHEDASTAFRRVISPFAEASWNSTTGS
jgi:uncharacterized protein (TIGR04255 family)